MTETADRFPVVAAAGQWTETEQRCTPLDLAVRASEEALSSAPGLRSRIDSVVVVNILSGVPPAAGSLLARRLGLEACRRAEVTAIGGNSPQSEVNRACAQIASGEVRAVLIAGAEAQRSRLEDRDDEGLPADPIVGDSRLGVGPAELAAGLIAPVHIYALFESVLAHRTGRTFEDQRRWLGEMMAPLSAVAASNPHAWFRQARTPSEIASVDPSNRLVAEPYTKLMCAFINVDQAAAIVVCSLDEARAAGAADGAVFCLAGASANDVWFPAERSDPGTSPAIGAASGAALEAADVAIGDVGAFDLYSCFPCALEMACDALALDPLDDRGLTVTGGLPYFGGPGNDYTLHAIATMAARVRERGQVGLVSGLGWFATKHAYGVYGPKPPAGGWRVGDTSSAQTAIDASAAALADRPEGQATVIASTVAYGRDGSPSAAPAIVRFADGSQSAATADRAELSSLMGVNLVGERVAVSPGPGTSGPVYRRV